MLEIIKGQVAFANKTLPEEKMNAFGLSSISAVDRASNTVSIRPDGIDPNSFDSGNMLLVSLSSGEILEGSCKPPKDLFLHLSIYKNFPKISSIAHVYPNWLSIYAQAGKSIPVFSSKHAARFKNEIPCTRGLTDTEIEEHFLESVNTTVIEALQNCEGTECGGVIIRYDGAIACGETPWKALDNAKAMEEMARAAWHTEAICKDSFCPPMPVALAKKYYSFSLEDGTDKICVKPGNQITLNEERQICLELLIYFDKVCRANEIKYSLTGGTLLGAVRHGGFIPWDDDVDVFLTRPEYNKLDAAFGNGGNDRYTFVTRKSDRTFNFVYGRLIDTKTIIVPPPNTSSVGKGLFLDVCVVDGLPNNRLLRSLHIAYMRFLFRGRIAVIHNRFGQSKPSKKPIVIFLKKMIGCFTTLNFWNSCLIKAMDRYSFENSKYVGNFTSQYGRRELLHKSVFDSYTDVVFENHRFMVCKGYDEYLRNVYGENYMTLPPEEKRKGHHPNTAFWTE